MKFKSPKFWSKKSFLSKILLLFSWIYQILFLINSSINKPKKVSVPVICIGNITMGGAGKTPTAIAIGKYLIDQGYRIQFLSRGYGGKYIGPYKVRKNDNSKNVGDEPLLLSKIAPTWVSKNRFKGAKEIEKLKPDFIIMDDGFQNNSIYKDFSILVIDNEYVFGNGNIFPSGPLREKFKNAINRTDIIVLIVKSEGENIDKIIIKNNIPLYTAIIEPIIKKQTLTNQNVVAFCGIARPDKFYSSLKKIGARIKYKKDYPDHYQYKPDEIMSLVEKAYTMKAILITTKKDWVRLPEEAKKMVYYLDISLNFTNNDSLRDIINLYKLKNQ
ncbi:tetraacyldisaccharide 4'-kinase [Alphaproteobacteria bacterium]|nr:tetraacyldisaccharide 4'-kinase [Alphaproteobacteria bacterium]